MYSRIVLPLCLLAVVGASIAPTHLFVSRAGPCGEAPKMAVRLSEFGITRKFYDFIISGQMNITKNFSNGWDMQATMQKCPDIRNLDTCDFYRSFPVVRAGCTGHDAPGFDLYTMFFHYTHPRMSCPILAGNYTIENYPYYTEDNYLAVAETKISTSVFGYTLRLEAFSGEEQKSTIQASTSKKAILASYITGPHLRFGPVNSYSARKACLLDSAVMCLESYLRLLYIRNHNWLDAVIDEATEVPSAEANDEE